MPDMEKIIIGLKIQLDDLQKYADPDEMLTLTQEQTKEIVALLEEQEAAYQGAVELLRQKTILFDDAIKRLKKQEAVKPVRDKKTGRVWLCGKCGSYVGFEDNDPHDPNEFDKYCRECGRPVLWEGR